MPRAWFRIWGPGKYRLRDGLPWEDTAEDVRNGYVQGKRQLAAGLWIPCCWEHQPHAMPAVIEEMKTWTPDRRAQFARNTFGHVVDYDLRHGELWAELDVPDHKDLEQLRKTRGFSPRLDTDAVDQRGRTYPGKSVGHVAATPIPVQIGGGPVSVHSTRAPAPAQLSKALPRPHRGTADSLVAVLRRQAELARKYSVPGRR
jgi:hypothetical protein